MSKINMRVGARQPLEDDQSRPNEAARVAARVLLQRALNNAACDVAETVRPGSVCIVFLHNAAWCQIVEAVWTEMIVAILAAETWPSPVTFATNEIDCALDALGEKVAKVLGSGRGCTMFAIDSDALPPELLISADRLLRLEPLDRSLVDGMLVELCGAGPTSGSLTDAEAAALTPVELLLTYRAGQSANEFMGRLEDLLEARAPAEPIRPSRTTVRSEATMDRLHGMDEAVAWGRSLARDLAAYRDGKLQWDDVDCGCLLSGPPGCGKTTFVKALASDCGVPLITGTYGEWQAAGHQGDMLKAMRKSFAAARRAAPSILFIDEFDSFGDRATLSSSSHNGHYELQVTNALLAELDGVQGHEGVVIIGACNYPDKLDPALMRSGRLDRHIRIPMPGNEAMAAILREQLGDDLGSLDLRRFAYLATGFTGADCERLVRLARRRARSAGRGLEAADLEAELLPTETRPASEMETAAAHEAGHAVAASLLLAPGTLMSVGLRRSGNTGGVTILRSDRARVATEAEVDVSLVFLLAGRAAEEILIGSVSAGAGGDHGSDLALATATALHAVSAFGFGAGGLVWRGKQDINDVPSVLSRNPGLAAEVRGRLALAYGRALHFITDHQTEVSRVADELLSLTVLDASEIEALVKGGVRPTAKQARNADAEAPREMESASCRTF